MNRYLLLAVILTVVAWPASAEVIDTTPAWDFWGATGGFGVPSITTMGQTFIAPSSQMDQFTFWLEPSQGDVPPFYAYLMAWDDENQHPTDGSLWQSTLQHGPSAPGFTPYTFSPAVSLTPGARYVAFLSSSGLFDYDNYTVANSWFGAVTSGNENPYAGGEMVMYGGGWFFNLGYDNFELLTTRPWDVGTRDAAFHAEFSGTAIPEPATFVLLGGALAVGWFSSAAVSNSAGIHST